MVDSLSFLRSIARSHDAARKLRDRLYHQMRGALTLLIFECTISYRVPKGYFLLAQQIDNTLVDHEDLLEQRDLLIRKTWETFLSSEAPQASDFETVAIRLCTMAADLMKTEYSLKRVISFDEGHFVASLDRMLISINPRQDQAIRLYYGLQDTSMSYPKVGKELGVTGKRARDIVKQGIFKLREAETMEIFSRSYLSEEHIPELQRELNDAMRRLAGDSPSAELLSKGVYTLGINNQAINALMRRGITTIGEIVEMSPQELLETRGFGKKSLHEIECVLREEHGLSLQLM